MFDFIRKPKFRSVSRKRFMQELKHVHPDVVFEIKQFAGEEDDDNDAKFQIFYDPEHHLKIFKISRKGEEKTWRLKREH